MKVSVVIPTSNGARFLAPCLEALERTRLPAGAEIEPIVVDNGSTDGTAELLAGRSEVKALYFPKPLGFAGANNAARAVATGDVVCFLNNDTQVDPGWIERPLEIFARDPTVAGVGSKLLFMHRFVPVRFSLDHGAKVRVGPTLFDGPLDDKVRWSSDVRDRWVQDGSAVYVPMPVPRIDAPLRAPPVLRLYEGEISGLKVRVGDRPAHAIARLPAIVPVEDGAATLRLIQNAGNFLTERCEGGDVGTGEEDVPGRYDREEAVPAICGAALFARRDALDAVGWFPDYYTVYYEDVDLCLRLRSRGGTLVFCPSSIVNHYHTGTNREHSSRFIENVARSSLLFVSRYGAPGVIARALRDRIRYSRDELVHGGGWRHAAGMRGFLSAVPALRRTLASRIGDRLRGRPGPAELVGTRRVPYQPSR